MARWTLALVVLLAGSHAVNACLAGVKHGTEKEPTDDSAKENTATDDAAKANDDGAADPFKNKAGTDAANTEPYDNSAYEDAKKSGTTVSDGDELACDFDSGSCCWGNTEDGDSHDWRTSDEAPNEELFAENFNSLPPSDTYLVTANVDQRADSKALFVSCEVGCAKDSLLLTVDHWRTGSASLQVCKRDVGSDELKDCADVPQNETPGPSLVELPGGENFEVVIVAGNMVAADGDIVIIDNIVVTFDPCDEDEEKSKSKSEPKSEEKSKDDDSKPTKGDGSGGAACDALQCSFDGNTCDYKAGKVPGSSDDEANEFEAVDGQFGPASTGPRGEEDKFYGAALVPSGKTAAMSADTDAPEDLVLRFRYWESTEGMKAVACADSDCSFETQLDVAEEDFAWREGSLLVPKGTKTVTLGAVNEGTNQGAIGFSKLTLLKAPAGGDAEDASEGAC